MSVERVQSDSMISQSVAAQPKTQKTHQCEYYTEMKKANKIIQKKNREIQTLNRIIKNLKIDINELNSNKKQSKEEVHELRQQLDQARKKLSELQLKQIQNQRQICEQRLQSAQKLITNQRQSKIKRDSSQDYFSECQFSRNTNDEKYIIMESSKKRDSMQCTFQSNRDLHAYDKKSMNMGQLFMGKKMKLQVEDARLYKNSSWGKFQLLHQGNVQHPSYGYDSSSSFMRKTPSFGGYEGRMNVQQAINYLKLENQGLKMSIF